jgi:hypothetical protein
LTDGQTDMEPMISRPGLFWSFACMIAPGRYEVFFDGVPICMLYIWVSPPVTQDAIS